MTCLTYKFNFRNFLVSKYGYEILEALKNLDSLPMNKKHLLMSFDNLIYELSELELENFDLDEYKKARGFINALPENEITNVCIEAYDLYHDIEKYL
ncbi:hypothetical protein ikelab_22600 [Lactococcus garvieae]|uniref:Uncharacterized protein n=1 Tax=Lactococcus garvieae TaxID=1363 RepID=A0A6L2ZZ13_9LACT|nr:hypothetical protein [Lactococcus garvieae]GFO52985.1 hypothetical protein ikelab_22600 [Lactococcus garvieae]